MSTNVQQLIDVVLDKQISQLPKTVFYCSKCVNSNQRPRLQFDENRVCDACRYAYDKDRSIDWKKREEELLKLLDKHRSRDKSYDVIVPCSGGKDSGYVAHQLKYYKLPPLEELKRAGVTKHWLSYYKKWVPQQNYYYSQKNTGFKPNPDGRSEGTYSKYASLDDRTDGFHFYMQFIKFTFGRCTSEAAMKIRTGCAKIEKNT